VFRTPHALFRALAIAEVFSWTLLIAGIILRATAGLAIAVTIGGAIHGFVFLSYGVTALLVALNNRWRAGATVLALASAVIPYATIPVELGLARRGLLDGPWRTEDSADAADRRWYDGVLAWFLRRSWLLLVLIAAAVAAVYVVLLLVGPPGGDH
jgi:integral membrane protein